MSFDLVRQTTTTMTSPFTLAVDAGFDTLASRYAVGAPIFVGLQGRDASGAPVAQRCVGVGQLLGDGTLQVDSVSAGSNGAALPAFSCDSIVVVDVMSIAAVSALAAAPAAALAATLGDAALLDVGSTAGTVAAGDDVRFANGDAVWLDTGARGVPGWIYQGGTGGSGGVVAGTTRLVPFFVSADIDITSLLLSVTAAGGTADVSLWELTPQRASPGFAVGVRVAQVTGVSVAAIAAVEVPITASLTRGKWYAAALTVNEAFNISTYVLFAPSARTGRSGQAPGAAGSNSVIAYVAATGYPAPATWVAPVTVSLANGVAGFRSPLLMGWT